MTPFDEPEEIAPDQESYEKWEKEQMARHVYYPGFLVNLPALKEQATARAAGGEKTTLHYHHQDEPCGSFQHEEFHPAIGDE